MQLVELQQQVHGPRGHEVAVVAISYDPVDVLAGFAAEHGIDYPLLSDVGSRAIRELGLENTRIVEERAYWGREVTDRHRGLPYPGTFLVDEDGVVVDKLFERSHRLRPSGRLALERLVGSLPGTPPIVRTATGPAVRAAASLDDDSYYPNQVTTVRVRLEIDEGWHVYVPPVPQGFVPLEVGLRGPQGVFTGPVELPAGRPFTVAGLPERFQVVEGVVDVAVPFYVLEDTAAVDVRVAVRYQACSATTCLPPEELTMDATLTERERP